MQIQIGLAEPLPVNHFLVPARMILCNLPCFRCTVFSRTHGDLQNVRPAKCGGDLQNVEGTGAALSGSANTIPLHCLSAFIYTPSNWSDNAGRARARLAGFTYQHGPNPHPRPDGGCGAASYPKQQQAVRDAGMWAMRGRDVLQCHADCRHAVCASLHHLSAPRTP